MSKDSASQPASVTSDEPASAVEIDTRVFQYGCELNYRHSLGPAVIRTALLILATVGLWRIWSNNDATLILGEFDLSQEFQLAMNSGITLLFIGGYFWLSKKCVQAHMRRTVKEWLKWHEQVSPLTVRFTEGEISVCGTTGVTRVQTSSLRKLVADDKCLLCLAPKGFIVMPWSAASRSVLEQARQHRIPVIDQRG